MNQLKFLLSLGAMAFCFEAKAASTTVETPTALSIQGLSKDSKNFAEVCNILKEETLAWSFTTQRTSDCLMQTYNYQNSQYGTTVEVRATERSELKLTIRNLRPTDDTDPTQLTWTVPQSAEGLVALRKLVKNYGEFDANKNDLKKDLLVNGTGEPVNDETFKAAYSAFSQKDPKNKKYLAAGLEIAAILGVSVYGYYSVPAMNNPNNRDWDYKTASEAFRKRLNGDAVRFDDNHFHTNRGHYYAGAVYYVAAREAGLDRLESLLVTFAASSFWEYAGEYREVVSINDQINTTLGGFIIGESIHQVAKIFQKGPDTLSKRILSGIFGSPAGMSRWVQSKATGNSYALEHLSAEEQDFWSKLDLYTTISKIDGHQLKQLGFDAEVVNIPMFEEPGRVHSMYLPDTVQSQLQMEYGKGVDIETFKMFSKITLAAIYEKNMGADKNDQLQGYQLFIGPAMALEINQKTIKGDTRRNGSDFMGIVHVLGGTADMTVYQNGFKIHAVIDIYGDFAMMRSWAFDPATRYQYVSTPFNQANCNGIQSVLCHEGYYYGVGSTQEAKVVVSNGKVEVGVGIKNINTGVINEHSRFSETATVNTEARDQVTSLRGWVVYQLSRNLKVEFGAEKTYRSGSALGTSISTTEILKYGKLIYQYN